MAEGACYLAHSANKCGQKQSYIEHVGAVRHGARLRAQALLKYNPDVSTHFLKSLDNAAEFHDLGKLDWENQAALNKGKGGRLIWDHVDAGVAHLLGMNDETAAWLVRAHHAPGLPNHADHKPNTNPTPLRGLRNDDDDFLDHDRQRKRTDETLSELLKAHRTCVGADGAGAGLSSVPHGLTLRFGLSCLVDADHSDTARHETGLEPATSHVLARWQERLDQLKLYVSKLDEGQLSERNQQRYNFFLDCLNSEIDVPIVSCEGPVGIGKTTAVTAFLLSQAIRKGLRRLFVVAPYTNVLVQLAENLRKALVLEGEDPQQVVVEHHHRADFENEHLRDCAALWRAPIIVTTAVQFFETLASNQPSTLRKLHELPGSAIFIDEAHAAMPTRLWKQNLEWLRELGEHWSCCTVFASGSLARFWNEQALVVHPLIFPELLPPERAKSVLLSERRRVSYGSQRPFDTLDDFVAFLLEKPGPRIVVMNTVQNAAKLAQKLSDQDHTFFQISTALCPADRAIVLQKVKSRLEQDRDGDWTLVGTSCIEAGLNLSFKTGFRERFSVASILQLGGRVNRDSERGHDCFVFDFIIRDGDGITKHPAAKYSADIVRKFFKDGFFDAKTWNPADLVTSAMQYEIEKSYGVGEDFLYRREQEQNYPEVAKLGRVIEETDTITVIVKQTLREALNARERVGFRTLMDGSVQLWTNKGKQLQLSLLPVYGDELYDCPSEWYDPEAMGIMKGILRVQAFISNGGAVI